MYDVTQSANSGGVVLDAGREVRVKLYMGQVRLFPHDIGSALILPIGLYGLDMVHSCIPHARILLRLWPENNKDPPHA